jgi:diguanylate cyclase
MIKPPLPANEPERLAALRNYEILDTPPEESFDDLALLAAHICGTPSASVSLVDEARQWFKASVGVEARETGRDVAFCAHGILQPDLLIVPDATQDARFIGNPLVTGAPHIQFYAGAPMTTAGGLVMGMVCVTDRQPRTLRPEQEEALRRLARQAVAQLELRKRTRDLEAKIVERDEVEKALRTSEERFRHAFDDAPIGMSLVNPDGRWLKVNRALNNMLGYTEAELLATDFQHVTHPDDLTKDLELVRQVLAGTIPSYRMEKRYFHKTGKVIFASLSVSLVRDRDGTPLYFVSQIENITERKQHEEERDKIIAELQELLMQVKTLSGLIPICGWCKSVRSDKGYWQTVEQYVRSNSSVTFSHGICPSCSVKFKDEIDRAGGNSPSDSHGDFDPHL